MLITRVLLATLFFTVSAAARTVEFSPAAPTSATPITITVMSEPSSPCAPTLEAVTRTGSVVRVHLAPYTGACVAVIAPWRASYDIGTVPPGEYELAIHVGSSLFLSTKFVVRNAEPAFTLHPFAHVSRPAGPQIDSGVEAVIEGVPVGICNSGLCPNVRVFFGDIAVQPRADRGLLHVRVPPHAPGVFDVKVVDNDRNQTWTSAGAVYFYDRDAAPDLTVWERVLFPVLQSGPGAFGAQWTTDTAILNNQQYVVENFNRVDSLQCIDVGCERLGARQFLKFEGRDHPRGAVLLVPRESAGAMSFASRVRDRAREGEDFGTEVPVVRESAMRRSQFLLLDVPVSSAYRSKLRLYVYTPLDGLQVGLTLSSTTYEYLFFRSLPLTRVDRNLAYAEIDLQTIGEVDEDRVILQITPPAFVPAWGFVTVTNNATQRVTLVTPN